MNFLEFISQGVVVSSIQSLIIQYIDSKNPEQFKFVYYEQKCEIIKEELIIIQSDNPEELLINFYRLQRKEPIYYDRERFRLEVKKVLKNISQ